MKSTKRVALFFTCALTALVAAFVCDSFVRAGRLSAEVARRASTRWSTNLASRVFSEGSSDLTPATRDDFSSATERYVASSADSAEAARIAACGLENWNLVDFSRSRASDARASREAIDVLSTFESDEGIDSALAFLRELDDASGDSTTVLIAFKTDRGNPLNSVGVVSPSELVVSPLPELAKNALIASARVFFLITLGTLLPFSRLALRFVASFARFRVLVASRSFLFAPRVFSRDSLFAIRTVRMLD